MKFHVCFKKITSFFLAISLFSQPLPFDLNHLQKSQPRNAGYLGVIASGNKSVSQLRTLFQIDSLSSSNVFSRSELRKVASDAFLNKFIRENHIYAPLIPKGTVIEFKNGGGQFELLEDLIGPFLGRTVKVRNVQSSEIDDQVITPQTMKYLQVPSPENTTQWITLEDYAAQLISDDQLLNWWESGAIDTEGMDLPPDRMIFGLVKPITPSVRKMYRKHRNSNRKHLIDRRNRFFMISENDVNQGVILKLYERINKNRWRLKLIYKFRQAFAEFKRANVVDPAALDILDFANGRQDLSVVDDRFVEVSVNGNSVWKDYLVDLSMKINPHSYKLIRIAIPKKIGEVLKANKEKVRVALENDSGFGGLVLKVYRKKDYNRGAEKRIGKEISAAIYDTKTHKIRTVDLNRIAAAKALSGENVEGPSRSYRTTLHSIGSGRIRVEAFLKKQRYFDIPNEWVREYQLKAQDPVELVVSHDESGTFLRLFRINRTTGKVSEGLFDVQVRKVEGHVTKLIRKSSKHEWARVKRDASRSELRENPEASALSPGELIEKNAESHGFKIRFAILVKNVQQAWKDGLAEMVKQKVISEETAKQFEPTDALVKNLIAVMDGSPSKSSLQKNSDEFFKSLGLNAPKMHILIRPVTEAYDKVWKFVQRPGGLEFPPVLDPKIKADFDRDPKNQDHLTQLMEITFRADAVIHLTRHIVAIYGDLEDLKKMFKEGMSANELETLRSVIIKWAESWLDEVANDRLMVRLNKKVSPKSYMISAVVIDWVKKFKTNIEESDPDSLAETIDDFLGNMDHLNSDENHYLYNEMAYEALALLNEFEEIVVPFETNAGNPWMRIMAKSVIQNKKLLQKHVSWPNLTANVRGVAGKKDISEYVRLRYFQGALINYGHWRSLEALAESGALAIYILRMDEQVDTLAEKVLRGNETPDADAYLSIVVRANTTRLLMAESKFGGNKMNSAPIAPADVYMTVREPFANWFFRTERAEYLNKFTVNTESSEALFTQVDQAKADFATSFAQSHDKDIETTLQQGENLEIVLRNLIEENFEPLKNLLEKLNVLYSFAENGVMPQLREQAQEAYFGTDEEPGFISRYDAEANDTIRLLIEAFLKQRAAKYRLVSDNARLAFNLLSTRRQGAWPIKDRIWKEAEGGKIFIKDEEAFPFVDETSLAEIFPALNAEFFKLLNELHHARLIHEEVAPGQSERIAEFTKHEATFFHFYDLLCATLGIKPAEISTEESPSDARSELRDNVPKPEFLPPTEQEKERLQKNLRTTFFGLWTDVFERYFPDNPTLSEETKQLASALLSTNPTLRKELDRLDIEDFVITRSGISLIAGKRRIATTTEIDHITLLEHLLRKGSESDVILREFIWTELIPFAKTKYPEDSLRVLPEHPLSDDLERTAILELVRGGDSNTSRNPFDTVSSNVLEYFLYSLLDFYLISKTNPLFKIVSSSKNQKNMLAVYGQLARNQSGAPLIRIHYSKTRRKSGDTHWDKLEDWNLEATSFEELRRKFSEDNVQLTRVLIAIGQAYGEKDSESGKILEELLAKEPHFRSELRQTERSGTMRHENRADFRSELRSGRLKASLISKLLAQHRKQLKGLNLYQAARLIKVHRSSLFRHFKKHPKNFRKYRMVKGVGGKASQIPRSLERHRKQLKGLNLTKAAKLIGISRRHLDLYIKDHPEDFREYGLAKSTIGMPPRIPKLLERHKDKLRGLNINQAARVIRMSGSGLAYHLRKHPKDFRKYGIKRQRSELRLTEQAQRILDEALKYGYRSQIKWVLGSWTPDMRHEIARVTNQRLRGLTLPLTDGVKVRHLIIILGILGIKEKTDGLIRILEFFTDDSKGDWFTDRIIADGLQVFIKLGSTDQIPLIAKFLTHKIASVRQKAVKALGKLKATSYISDIERLSNEDASQGVRKEALWALQQLQAEGSRSELRIKSRNPAALFLGLVLSLAPVDALTNIQRSVSDATRQTTLNRSQITNTLQRAVDFYEPTQTNEKIGAIAGNELVFADGAILLLPAFADMFGTVVVITPTQIEESAIEAVRASLKPGQEIITARNYQEARFELRRRGFTSEHVMVGETDPILTIKQWATRVTIFNKTKIGEMLSGLETAVQQIQAALRIAYAA